MIYMPYKEINYKLRFDAVDCSWSGSWKHAGKCLVCKYYRGTNYGFSGPLIRCAYHMGE